MSQRSSWVREHIETLIEAYKFEKCLYAVKSPSYHNKNLRAEALQRITNTIAAIRPGTNKKDCSSKFNNLRTQFNIENAKVQGSMKSGVGAKDVYVPSLWYFKSLSYLAEHVVPRKSTASMTAKRKIRQVSQEVANEIHHTPTTSTLSTVEFTENRLMVYEEDVDDPGVTELPANTDSLTTAGTSEDKNTETLPGITSTSQSSIQISSISRLSRDSSGTIDPRPHMSSGQKPSTSSGVIDSPVPQTSNRIQKRRKKHSHDGYVGVMASIADFLKQPMTIPKTTANPADPIENCTSFIGSMLRGFASEKLRLEVMHVLVQTVINARTSEFERP